MLTKQLLIWNTSAPDPGLHRTGYRLCKGSEMGSGRDKYLKRLKINRKSTYFFNAKFDGLVKSQKAHDLAQSP